VLHYRVNKRPSIYFMFSHLNPVRHSPPTSLRSILISSSHLCLPLTSDLRFRDQHTPHSCDRFHTCCMSVHHLARFMSILLREDYIMKLFTTHFIHLSLSLLLPLPYVFIYLYIIRTTQHKYDQKHSYLKSDSNPQSQRPSNQGLRLRPRGHWDLPSLHIYIAARYSQLFNLCSSLRATDHFHSYTKN
jgi:hypothetical protein